MSLTKLPDVALIKIFRTLDHIELVRLYHSFHSLKRIQILIENSSCLWTHIHIKNTVDYNLFTYFSRLLLLNSSTVRELIIDQLDLTCRKILDENKFVLKKFLQLEQLIVHDEYISNSIQNLNFCSLTLKILHLTNNHMNLNNLYQLNQLNSLQMNIYSKDLLENSFEKLSNLHLKIMFDHDLQSHEIFPCLPRRSLKILTLKFLLLNNDMNFLNQFNSYLNSCLHLHTLELFYLHSMCPLVLHTNLNYSKYQRIVLVNICQLKQMKNFVEINHVDLPNEYLQYNSVLNLNQYSSYIQNQYWHRRQLISIDYIQCVTTSMDLLNEMDIIWSDKNQTTQSFESYILRSIYNVPHIISSLHNLTISKFELSLNGLITLMTNLPLVKNLLITDGRIDQMGSGILDIEKILNTITNISQSDIQTIEMNNIHISCRTVVNFCLITQKLLSLKMNDVKILNKTVISQQNNPPNLLNLLKQIAQTTEQFKWNNLKSLTLGKNLLNRSNLSSFFPTQINHIYGRNLNHLCIILSDQTLLENSNIFLKSIKKFIIRNFPKLTSFIIEFTKFYEGQYRLRNQLQTLFELNTNKKVYVYPTVHDRACRFCFDTDSSNDNEDDDDRSISSQSYRTFCGIPLFQCNKQRKSNSNVFS